MLPVPMDSNRTEAPTPRRRERARREGHVARSPQLSFAAGLLALGALGSFAGERGLVLVRSAFQASLDAVRDGGDPVAALHACARAVVPVFVVPPVVVFLAVWLVGLAQVGPMFSPAAMAPRTGVGGARWRAMFSVGRVGEAAWAALAAVVLVLVWGAVLWDAAPGLIDLQRRTPSGAGRLVAGALLRWLTWAGALLAAFGVADLVLRRLSRLRALRMTRRERLREARETEGDPRVRAAQRHQHASLSVESRTDARVTRDERDGR